jgi:hypothetical protein
MSEWETGEKQEKEEEKAEKEHEKEYEKEQEKSWEEKYRRDPLGVLVWGAILIWAGVALLLENLGLVGGAAVSGWGLALAGAGVILLVEAAIRYLVPAYRRPVAGTTVLGVFLIAVGLGLEWELLFPALLIALGLVILGRAVLRRR